jgi:hypothetical protein
LTTLSRKIKRLKKLKVDEIKLRLSQQASMFSERRGWSKHTTLPSDDEFLTLLSDSNAEWGRSTQIFIEHLRTRSQPRFFPSFQSKDETLRDLLHHWPNVASEIIEAATGISEGRFHLLGLRDLDLGKKIDWHLEPTSDKRTPLSHWSLLNYLDASVAGDKKITWELNRHQYFSTLGRAYWLTGDEQYAEVFVSHVVSWMDENPPKLGINWASSLEIAFRSIAWLWAIEFFKNSPALTPSILLRIIKVLRLNASHLETYLSTYFSPNTHLTGEALGLFYLGLMLPELKESERWRDEGLRILVSQLPRHVQADGVYFEQSSYYHRYTADFYTHLTILLRANGLPLPDQLEPTLKLLLDHLMYITRPDGTTPFFGDDDGGRLVMLDNRPANDFRAVLSTGASLFNRPDYKFVAGTVAEETIWLLGSKSVRVFEELRAQPPAKESVAFDTGGYYVLRDGWSSDSNYLLFDCGPHGTDNCGHAHSDALAIEVAALGKTVLVDPGTFTYTGSSEMRDWFRSSAAHNTLTLDGQSSSVSAGPFSWKTTTHCERLAWLDHPRFTYVSGRHNGYQRLTKPGTHTRSILFLKRDYWFIRDKIEVTGTHEVGLWFHFESGTSPEIQVDGGRNWISQYDGEHGLNIIGFPGDNWTKEEQWVSHCYGEKTCAPVCVLSSQGEGSLEINTFLMPRDASMPEQPRVTQFDVVGGVGFEVLTSDGRDLLIINNEPDSPPAVPMNLVHSDFDYTWLRFIGDHPTPEEGIVLGGHLLEVGDRKIVQSSKRAEFLVLKKESGELRAVHSYTE